MRAVIQLTRVIVRRAFLPLAESNSGLAPVPVATAAQPTVRAEGLRVLAFCDYFSATSCGGAERVTLEVYRRLASLGVDVTVVAGVPSLRRESTEQLHGIRVISIPSVDLSGVLGAEVAVSRGLLHRAFAIADAFRPHVLHANALHFQGSLGAAVLQRRRGLPLVTTAHIGALSFLPPTVRLPTAGYEATIGRFILRRSARAIAVSPSVANHLSTLGMAAQCIDVVPNGVDHARFFPTLRPVSGTPLVAFVGRLIANKGPQVLLDALTELRDGGLAFRAVFVGDGPLRGSLEQAVRKREMERSVSFTGQVRNVEEHLRQADIVVRPSFTEGMPLAVLEAMASGVCVIASDVPGNADLLVDRENGLLFPPGDVERLAAELRWAVQNPASRRKLGMAAHEHSLDHSWDITSARTLRVLEGVATSTTARTT